MVDRVTHLADHALEGGDLSPRSQAALRAIRAELDAEYRERFLNLSEALSRQAAALDRIQTTLQCLLEKVAPELKGVSPPAIRVALPDESPDIASAVVVSDPLSLGFTLTQADIAEALDLSEPDVSVLIRALKIREDHRLAVEIRRGKRGVWNYHRAAVQRLVDLVRDPDCSVPKKHTSVRRRVAEQLEGRGAR